MRVTLSDTTVMPTGEGLHVSHSDFQRRQLKLRMELFSNLTKDEEKRIVLVHAMRDSKEELKKLYVADAKEVFILGDSGELDDVEYYHDSMNVDCLNLIGELCKEENRKPPLKCNVLFEYQSTFAVFQFSDIDDDIKEYIDDLFCVIDKAQFFSEDNFSDSIPSCSGCINNTANHGCLFYEMKGKEQKCINRECFEKKQQEYVKYRVMKEADNLVKKGEPLTFGKSVILIESPKSWDNEMRRRERKMQLGCTMI